MLLPLHDPRSTLYSQARGSIYIIGSQLRQKQEKKKKGRGEQKGFAHGIPDSILIDQMGDLAQ